MNYKKKPIGAFIIGLAITLFVSVLPLLIFGDDPIGNKSNDQIYNYHLEGNAMFKWILGIGLSTTIIIISKYFQRNLRKILIPSLLGCILGIILGLLFPVRVWGETITYVYDFNLTLFLITISVGIFITLILLGTTLIKNS